VPNGGAANSGDAAPQSSAAPTPRPTTATAARRAGRSRHKRQLFLHYWLPVLLMLGLITVESTTAASGMHTFRLLAWLMKRLGISLGYAELELLNIILRKCGHLIGYGLLCYTWFLLLRGIYWFQHEYQLGLKEGMVIRRLWWRVEWAVVAVFCTFLVAVADETHQMTLSVRTGRWRDVALDTTAAILVATLLWLRARRRGQRQQS